jgi:hypothetical protein
VALGVVKKMSRQYRENIEGIETRNEIRSFSENNLIQGSCHSVRPVINEHATINDSTPVPAWLVAHREDAGGQNRCGKKDCVFPPLIHVSPPAERG